MNNGIFIPVEKDESSGVNIPVVEVDEMEWDINRTIIMGDDVNPESLYETFNINSNEMNETYQHLRITFSNWIDTNLNNQKIAGFFEFFGNYLDKNISAIQFWQYMPWAEANWLRDPQTLQAKAWQSVVRSMGALNWNPEAEKMIGNYLTNEWGFSALHFGSDSDDLLSGSSVADKFFGSAGNDKMNGGDDVDTVVYAGKRSNYTQTQNKSLTPNPKSQTLNPRP